jgi:hypothetical protein
MKYLLIAAILFSALALAACTGPHATSSGGAPPASSPRVAVQTSPPAAGEPLTGASLSLLMQLVPPDHLSYFTYSAPPVLTTYKDQTIPSREASLKEKMDWWSGFQDYVVAGYSYPGVTDIWGFEDVDLQGMLVAYYQSNWAISVFSGGFDLGKFRAKLISYGYAEEKYRGFSLYSGIPPLDSPATPSLRDFFPRAFGVVDVVKTATDQTSLIIMSYPTAQRDAGQAKAIIQSSLQAFADRSSLAYKEGGVAALGGSLGRVGAAFVGKTAELGLESRLQMLPADKSSGLVGPGKLGAFNELAIAVRGKGEIVEFTLTYGNASAAGANVPVLRQRLSQGMSVVTNRALTTFWTVQNVAAEGPYLKATVNLIPQSNGAFLKFNSFIFTQDYLFLTPN